MIINVKPRSVCYWEMTIARGNISYHVLSNIEQEFVTTFVYGRAVVHGLNESEGSFEINLRCTESVDFPRKLCSFTLMDPSDVQCKACFLFFNDAARFLTNKLYALKKRILIYLILTGYLYCTQLFRTRAKGDGLIPLTDENR